MRIIQFVESPLVWKSGIWYHRVEVPSRALNLRGHSVKQVILGENIPDQYMEFPDAVILGRFYPNCPSLFKIIDRYKKQGKKVIYDIDDDIWSVDEDNPSRLVGNAYKDQYERMIKEADAITTPSRVLAKKIRKLTKKPIYFCDNGIDFEDYTQRPKEHDKLLVGYMGASSHWEDLSMIADVIKDLNKKYDFIFVLYGMMAEPLEAAMYAYNRLLSDNTKPEENEYFRKALKFYEKLKDLEEMYHVPFYPPELHPSSLSKSDFDIGIAPLGDKEFNRGKSCLKFYEYAAVGTAVLASDVLPYKERVDYRAKNTHKDWYKKLEKLIVDDKFRKDLADKQQKWVKENRGLDKIGLDWEIACQKEGGLKVLNQKNWKNIFKL